MPRKAARIKSRVGGKRPGAGRKPVPGFCPKCGTPCKSARGARQHCLGK